MTTAAMIKLLPGPVLGKLVVAEATTATGLEGKFMLIVLPYTLVIIWSKYAGSELDGGVCGIGFLTVTTMVCVSEVEGEILVAGQEMMLFELRLPLSSLLWSGK